MLTLYINQEVELKHKLHVQVNICMV